MLSQCVEGMKGYERQMSKAKDILKSWKQVNPSILLKQKEGKYTSADDIQAELLRLCLIKSFEFIFPLRMCISFDSHGDDEGYLIGVKVDANRPILHPSGKGFEEGLYKIITKAIGRIIYAPRFAAFNDAMLDKNMQDEFRYSYGLKNTVENHYFHIEQPGSLELRKHYGRFAVLLSTILWDVSKVKDGTNE